MRVKFSSGELEAAAACPDCASELWFVTEVGTGIFTLYVAHDETCPQQAKREETPR